VELAQDPEHVTVCTSDILEALVLQQLVSVPDLDIAEALLVVIVQSMKQEMLIGGKVIRPAIVPSMTIAQDDELGGVAERDLFGGPVQLCQAFAGRHDGPPSHDRAEHLSVGTVTDPGTKRCGADGLLLSALLGLVRVLLDERRQNDRDHADNESPEEGRPKVLDPKSETQQSGGDE